MIKLSNAFQWSTSEQVWPFEKWSDGSILYAKRFDLGPLNAQTNVNHNITNLDLTKVRSCDGQYYYPNTSATESWVLAAADHGASFWYNIFQTQIQIDSGVWVHYAGGYAHIFLVYGKTA